ncbi:hypothetical protein EDD15DRAFT_2300597, partial [Pisolithus albus]
GFHECGWLPLSHSSRYALSYFPSVQSFTRTPLVIAAHRTLQRYCPTTGQTLEFTYFDLGSREGVCASGRLPQVA